MASDDEVTYRHGTAPSTGGPTHPDPRERVFVGDRGADGGAGRRGDGDPGQAVSPLWVIGSIVVGVLLVAWFFVAWLALDRHFIDAAGESIGSAFAVLLAASVVGAFRHNHDGSGPSDSD